MIPISGTTCTAIDATTTYCITYEATTTATGTPAIVWHYDAGELVISFLLVVLIGFAVFRGLIHVFE